LKQKKRKW